MEWVSSCAGYWLTIPSASAPTLMVAFLVDRINFGLKVFWVGWCLYCFSRVPVSLQGVISSGSISPMVTTTDSRASLLSQVSVSFRRWLHLLTPVNGRLSIISWPSSHLFCSSPHLILNSPFPSKFCSSVCLLWLVYSPLYMRFWGTSLRLLFSISTHLPTNFMMLCFLIAE